MNRVVIFLVVVYLASAVGAWTFYSKKMEASASLAQELTAIKAELAVAKTALDGDKKSRAELEKKFADARTNASFLSLALCPTLEATNKDALCIKNGTEWLSQTIISGTALTNSDAKAKMDALLIALGKKTKPTAKELYEMLKPIEVDSLKALTDNLK